MKHFFLFLFTVIGLSIYAQAPEYYYNPAVGKTESQLKTSLYNIIKGHTDKGYNGLFAIYMTSDNTSTGYVWDMYSTCTWTHQDDRCGNYSNICDCYNREHSIPQSWFSERSPMRSDAFQVYPTDGKVNGMRSNDPYGETNAAPVGGLGLGKVGTSSFPGYTGRVFEPVDEYKGDFARTYFYFVTRYENLIYSFSGASFNGTAYPSLSPWALNLFLKWHRQDPVSQKEIDRNNAIYVHQKNRNPFIDYPELAEYIWGDKKGVAWSENITTDPQILTPAHNSTIDFGTIPYQQNYSVIVDVKAANLTGDLTLGLSGANSSYFSLPTTTLSAETAETGTKLIITCNPQSIGTISATLAITGGGMSMVHTVNLKAVSSDSFMALQPTGVTDNAFTARWTASAGATGYLLDVFSYQETGDIAQTILEEDFDDGLPSNWNVTGYYDNQEQSSIRMASGSQNCELKTPTVDLSANTILTLRAKQYNSDNGATIQVNVNSELLTTFTTGAAYESFTVPINGTSSGASTITFTVQKGKRVYLDYVKIETEGTESTPVRIDGYPRQVGNVLEYHVTGLTSDSTYYYTVTPQGNGAQTSGEIQVKTAINLTNVDIVPEFPEPVVYFAQNTLYISNVEKGSNISIYNVLGGKILETDATADQVSLPFNYKGIYILQVSKNNMLTGIRKMILK